MGQASGRLEASSDDRGIPADGDAGPELVTGRSVAREPPDHLSPRVRSPAIAVEDEDPADLVERGIRQDRSAHDDGVAVDRDAGPELGPEEVDRDQLLDLVPGARAQGVFEDVGVAVAPVVQLGAHHGRIPADRHAAAEQVACGAIARSQLGRLHPVRSSRTPLEDVGRPFPGVVSERTDDGRVPADRHTGSQVVLVRTVCGGELGLLDEGIDRDGVNGSVVLDVEDEIRAPQLHAGRQRAPGRVEGVQPAVAQHPLSERVGPLDRGADQVGRQAAGRSELKAYGLALERAGGTPVERKALL